MKPTPSPRASADPNVDAPTLTYAQARREWMAAQEDLDVERASAAYQALSPADRATGYIAGNDMRKWTVLRSAWLGVSRSSDELASSPRIAPRPRGAGRPRARATRSSARSGDSGDDSDGGSSEPPDGRPADAKRCAAPWCSRPLYGSSRQRFCGTERCNRARAAERQRKRRADELTTYDRERLQEARIAGYIGAGAFLPAEQHALSFLWRHKIVTGRDPGEEKARAHRLLCRCNGHHIDGGTVGCFKCGLPRTGVAA